MAGVLDPLDRPNLTLEDLRDELDYVEDIPVTLRQLRNAVLAGELVPTKLSNKNYFSKRDGLVWIAAQRGKYRGDRQRAALDARTRANGGNGNRVRAAESGATPP